LGFPVPRDLVAAVEDGPPQLESDLPVLVHAREHAGRVAATLPLEVVLGPTGADRSHPEESGEEITEVLPDRRLGGVRPPARSLVLGALAKRPPHTLVL